MRHRLCTLAEAPNPGEGKAVAAGGIAVALFNVGGEFHAIEDSCPHMYFPLSDGEVNGCIITCAYHGWQFDLKTGTSVMSQYIRVKRFPVTVEDGALWVDLPDAS
jgi:nitrite reductase/ring-hydroxylating ferredoxin subunit